MDNMLNLSVVTPNGLIFSGKAKMVTLPGEEGEFGVLAGHADTLSMLKAGVIEIKKSDDKLEYVAINWGYAKVVENSVDVLIDDAIVIEGTSESEIATAIYKAKDLIDAASEDKIAISAVLSKVDSVGKSIL